MQNFKFKKEAVEKRLFSTATKIIGAPEYADSIIRKFAVNDTTADIIEKIELIVPMDSSVKQFASEECGVDMNNRPEGFVIKAEDGNVSVYSDTQKGTVYGLMSILRSLDDDGKFGAECICDYPFSAFRGIKLMMPSRSEIREFKKFIDMMVFFRHNTVMLEIGGAMEYKRHPEINEGWEEYAEFMSEYSGKSKKLQEFTYPWRKNSIHSNNGGGSYLTQDEIKDLIAYCTERDITIIPEVPSTSHCDYLLTRHPELAERPEDPYPDTFCPSNPDSYKLLFDVLDEVIDVFNPEVINIGHDEYYSINICDRCRKRIMTNDEILAEDLLKIHDYLASKNVKTMIWCDKLLNAETPDGVGFGGALNYIYFAWNKNGRLLGILEPTWQARLKMPKDLICMNWFWSYGAHLDEEIRDFPVVFGNFRGEGMTDFRKRCGDNTSGGMCSNWGATRPVYLQRNRIYLSMAYNDIIYWDTEYDDTDDESFTACVEGCFKRLFDFHYGVAANRKGKYIEFIHTTDRNAWYHEFVDGVFTCGEEYRKNYYLGNYEISYTDGTSITKEIFLGEQIGFDKVAWYGKVTEEGPNDGNPGQRNVKIEGKLGETAYSTLPVFEDGKVYYRYLMENPYPNKTLKDIKFVLAEGAEWNVDVREWKI